MVCVSMQMSSQGDDDETPHAQNHHHVSFAIPTAAGVHDAGANPLERAPGGSYTAQPLSAVDGGDQVQS